MTITTTNTTESVAVVKNYINGNWVEPKSEKYLNVINPASGAVLAKVTLSTADQVNEAIEVAAQAYKIWSQTPVSRRVQPLYQLATLMRKNEEEMARTLVAEVGKSLSDAQAEIRRAIKMSKRLAECRCCNRAINLLAAPVASMAK